MILQQGNILNEAQLKKLKEHKYSSSCISLLDPPMQKYWNWLVTLVPLWVAPNLITIVGLIINIVTSLILFYYSPKATEQAPWWATLNCAIGLFVYQSLDAIDGKQARRTGNSSPLGELFDHGCDSISTVFVSISSCCAVQLGEYPGWMLFQCLCASTLFYCAHWQTYVSGTLTFGRIDVTEGQLIVMMVMGTSSVASYLNIDFWGSNFFSFRLFSLKQLMTLFGAFCGLLNMFSPGGTFHKIFTGGAGKNGATIAGTSVLSPMLPLLCVVVPAGVIAYKSEQAVYHNHPVLYLITFGLIAAKITNRLVVAHMCKSEIHHRDPALLAPVLLFLNQYFDSFLSEYWLLALGFVWVLWDLVSYCCKVCVEICDSLNVYLFKIPAPSSHSTDATDGVKSHKENGSSTEQAGPVSSWSHVPGYPPGKF